MASLPKDTHNVEASPNVWIVPLAFPSHVKNFLEFAKVLATHKLTVTYFYTRGPAKALGVHTTVEKWRSEEGVDVHLRDLEIEEPEFADGLDDFKTWVEVMRQQEMRFDSILKQEIELGNKPTCVISDFWLAGIHENTVKRNVPDWTLSILSVGYTGAATYLSQLQSKGILKIPASPQDKDSQEELISLPGLPLMRICELDILSVFSSHVMFQFGKRNGLAVLKSDVVIFSTFQELEPRTFRELKIQMHNAAVKDKRETGELLTVGPIFPLTTPGAARPTGNDSDVKDRHPYLKFLDGQRDSSVLFVAFGSTWQLPPEQMLEIAFGLEASEQSFLCAFHPAEKTAKYPTGDIFDIIPPDLIIRIKGRGLFVQDWVPQLHILNHPAVGGFLSHCGQNSTLEGLSMGVPILTWPLFTDQNMNARFIVEEIQAGLGITKDESGEGLVDRTEVERKARALLQSEEGKAARKNALRIRELALRSVAVNGSSYNNMQSLVARIRGLAGVQ
ncbi:hypothetical protein R1flu_016083 [Riccia fluitans]|uniref:Glycosyltransferase n=1 Tax=Riccia fluitans TaxID=41844 RepID=A0ABD1YKU3_9MARC